MRGAAKMQRLASLGARSSPAAVKTGLVRGGSVQGQVGGNLLNTFVSTLYRTAEDIKIERKRLEELRQEREQQERRRQEWECQRYEKLEEIRAEEERVAALMGEAETWHKSQAIRTYIQAARENLIEVRGEVAPDSDADRWLHWASNQADRLDPLHRQSTISPGRETKVGHVELLEFVQLNLRYHLDRSAKQRCAGGFSRTSTVTK